MSKRCAGYPFPLAVLAVMLALAHLRAADDAPVRAIGSRLELFVDDWLIDQIQGGSLLLHSPTPREVAVDFNTPWPDEGSAYVTVFADGPRYRMVYRANPVK